MKFIFALTLSFLSLAILADDYWYFSDIQNVPLRDAATKEANVSSYIPNNTRLKIVEKGEEWSKIKTEFGDLGWVRNEVITAERPLSRKFKGVEDQAAKYEKKNAELLTKIQEQKEEVKQLKFALTEKDVELAKVKKDFDELVAASGNVVQIKSDYKKATLQLNDYYLRNAELEKLNNNQYLYWFLAGAVVLLIGVWIGKGSKKNSYSSNLRF